MNLNIQVLSLVVSFLYGLFLYLILEINYRFFVTSSILFKIIFSFLFVFVNTLLYFIILLYINNGYVHIYFIIFIMIGYLLCKVISKRFVNRIRVWYTKFNKK